MEDTLDRRLCAVNIAGVGVLSWGHVYIYIYIHMERERERYACTCLSLYIYIYIERERYTHTYIHTRVCVYIHSMCSYMHAYSHLIDIRATINSIVDHRLLWFSRDGIGETANLHQVV